MALAVRIISESNETDFIRLIASSMGTATISVDCEAAIMPNLPASINLTAAAPNLRESNLSKVVGAPPLCRCPRTMSRVSLPVSFPISSLTFLPMPPSLASAPPGCFPSTTLISPPTGFAPLCYDNDRIVPAEKRKLPDLVADLVDIKGYLGYQDNVRRP